MPSPAPFPSRVPQRVLVTEATSPAQTAAATRLAAILDVPLVTATDLTGAGDPDRLATFDGWVAVLGSGTRSAPLEERAEAIVHLQVEVPGALRSLVRRTVRRMRADAVPEPDLSWVDAAAAERPDLTVARLVGPEEIDRWLLDLERSVSG